MTDFHEITDELMFPDGPIATLDGPVLLAETAPAGAGLPLNHPNR